MRKNEWEGFFKKHRAALDTEEPDKTYLWEGIQAVLVKKKYNQKLKLWRVAAVLLAVCTLGQTAYFIVAGSPGVEESYPIEEIVTDGEERKGGFYTLEEAYQNEVEALKSEVREKAINPAEYAVLFDELEYLEEVKRDFRDEIPLANDKERIAEMLADTYEKKILLLERLLQQIERDEQQKNQFKEL